jgi:hypothetical protein
MTQSRPITPAEAYFLCSEITRLDNELAAARLLSANRLAAIRCALDAAATCESDPLAFLADQLAEENETPGVTGTGSGL